MSIFDSQKKPIEFDKEPIKPFGADMDFRELNAGGGSKLFKVNAEGLFMGAANYTDAPFKVSFAGAVTATNATITGAVTATSGAIGSFTIGTYLYTGSKTAWNDANAGVHMGSDGLGIGNNIFTVNGSTGALVATSANITGTINATSGKIGTATNYWSIGSTGITAVAASTDVIINYGKTDFGQDSTNGFLLGYDYSASVSKFEIGSSATKLFKYDGTDLSLTGGTITGGTVQTAASGQRIVMSSNVLDSYDASALRQKLTGSTHNFYDADGTQTGYIYGYTDGISNKRIGFVAGTTEIYLEDPAAGGSFFSFGNTAVVYCGHVKPNGAGTENLGDATFYWGDVSYKTLTDRGCLGSCDDGVELQDGRIVSDTEAIKAIKKRDDNKKTVYGMTMLDYKTFPKMSYKPAQKKGETEGVEMTSMFSVMLGAIRELTNRIEQLEKKIT